VRLDCLNFHHECLVVSAIDEGSSDLDTICSVKLSNNIAVNMFRAADMLADGSCVCSGRVTLTSVMAARPLQAPASV
jgi:hypothetical protein